MDYRELFPADYPQHQHRSVGSVILGALTERTEITTRRLVNICAGMGLDSTAVSRATLYLASMDLIDVSRRDALTPGPEFASLSAYARVHLRRAFLEVCEGRTDYALAAQHAHRGYLQ